MICRNCNAQLPMGALFCVDCGTKVETIEEAQQNVETEAQENGYDNQSMYAGMQGNGYGNQPMHVGMQGNGYGNQPMHVGMQGDGYGNQPMQAGMQGDGYGNQSMCVGMYGNDLHYQAESLKGKKRWIKFGIILLFVFTMISVFLPVCYVDIGIARGSFSVADIITEGSRSRYTKEDAEIIIVMLVICVLLTFVSIILLLSAEIYMLSLINAIGYILMFIYVIGAVNNIFDDLSVVGIGAYVPILLCIAIIVLTICGINLKKREEYIRNRVVYGQNR